MVHSPILLENKSQMPKSTTYQGNEANKDLYYSSDLYVPEALFSSWLSLSFFCVTTALLFYHMTAVKSLEADPRVAAFLAIMLMVISCAYVFYSIGPYFKRMNHVMNECQMMKACSDEQVKSIRTHKYIYMGLGLLTIGIEAVISILIIYKTRKLL